MCQMCHYHSVTRKIAQGSEVTYHRLHGVYLAKLATTALACALFHPLSLEGHVSYVQNAHRTWDAHFPIISLCASSFYLCRCDV
jgi:hypothetical protein